MSAIRSATSTAARLLGLEAVTGTLEVGMRADILCVAGDPLADLSRLASPALVLQAGRVVGLDAAWARS